MRKNDWKLVGLLVLISLSLAIYYHYNASPGAMVVVTVDGKEYATLPINEDSEFIIPGYNEGENTLQIKDGFVTMMNASCPDLICVHHKKINLRGESIVCLPNRVMVEIQGARDSTVDAVTK